VRRISQLSQIPTANSGTPIATRVTPSATTAPVRYSGSWTASRSENRPTHLINPDPSKAVEQIDFLLGLGRDSLADLTNRPPRDPHQLGGVTRSSETSPSSAPICPATSASIRIVRTHRRRTVDW
jgi:hypothetical protein